LVKKYFTPSKQVKDYIDNLILKYNINFDNTCCIFFRGLDKFTETRLCDYSEYNAHIKSVIEKNPNIKLLIQTDETEFLDYMKENYPDNMFYFKDEIRHLNKSKTLVENHFGNTEYFQMNFLAIVNIMSKCKYIVCNSSNVSLWIVLYREHNKNISQYLNGNWHTS